MRRPHARPQPSQRSQSPRMASVTFWENNVVSRCALWRVNVPEDANREGVALRRQVVGITRHESTDGNECKANMAFDRAGLLGGNGGVAFG